MASYLILSGCSGSISFDEDTGTDITVIDTSTDPVEDDISTDVEEEESSIPDRCDQELPGVIDEYASYCGEISMDHCSVSGCTLCQVCLADIAWCSGGIGCNCCGDGRCATLCTDESVCAIGESCMEINWFEHNDTYTTTVRICWPDASTHSSICY